MTPRAATVVNGLAYQAGWFAVVLGAAHGHALAGGLTAVALTIGHLCLSRDRRGETTLVVVAVAVGLAVESWQIDAGTYRLLAGAPATAPAPWLLALWAQFASTFRFGLSAVMRRPWLAALLGATGGPAAFLAGEALGAVVLWAPIRPALQQLAIGWAVGMATLAVVTRAVDARRPPAGYRAWRDLMTGRRRRAALPPGRSGSGG